MNRAAASFHAAFSVRLDETAYRELVEYGRGDCTRERAGLLLGRTLVTGVSVRHWIKVRTRASSPTSVTFTHEAWERIFWEMDHLYPSDAIVGWYHTHPGFGVFLSGDDRFIHANYFPGPAQVACVHDPLQPDMGFFRLVGGRPARVPLRVVRPAIGPAVCPARGERR